MINLFGFIMTRISAVGRRIIAKIIHLAVIKGFLLLISFIYFMTWRIQHKKPLIVKANFLRKHYLS